MTVSEQERLARVALARVCEPGTRALARVLEQWPAARVWESLQRGEPVPGVPAATRAGIATRVAGYDPRRDLDRVAALGARVVCPGDDEWPTGLDWGVDAMQPSDVRELAAPWALFVRGPHHLASAVRGAAAVVGARAASPYGLHVAGELAFGLAEAGVTVVSGGAYGIDAAAHRAALTARSAATVAVLACGVDVAYPRGNDQLLHRIAAEGLLVSELPPGSAPTRVRFLVRNRVIAGLAAGTVVVEAALRSGSLSTAGRANDVNRVVMAVPGPVTSATSAGCHRLIRDGKAVCVTSSAEVLELLGRPGEHLPGAAAGPADPRDALPEQVRRVLDAVPVRAAAGVAAIARTAGVSTLTVQQVLPALLVAGLVEQAAGGWRLSALGAGGTRPGA